jgi:hypothetical protein
VPVVMGGARAVVMGAAPTILPALTSVPTDGAALPSSPQRRRRSLVYAASRPCPLLSAGHPVSSTLQNEPASPALLPPAMLPLCTCSSKVHSPPSRPSVSRHLSLWPA